MDNHSSSLVGNQNDTAPPNLPTISVNRAGQKNPIRNGLNIPLVKFSKKYLILFISLGITLFILYLFGFRLYLPPYGRSNYHSVNNINYSNFLPVSDQWTKSLNISHELSLLPQINIMEFGISNSDTTSKFLLGYIPHVAAFVPRMPSYRYTIQNNKFILGPAISCDSLKTTKSIFLNSWYNEIRIIKDFPQEYTYKRGDQRINIKINSINPDGSAEINFNNKKFTLQPDQEYTDTWQFNGALSKNTESWHLKNISNAKVQCFPDFVTDTKVKDDLLRSEANSKADEKYCQQITSESIIKACYADIYFNIIATAIDTNNAELCETIDPAQATHDMRARCFSDLAQATKNADLCQKILDPNNPLKTQCYILTSNLESCLKIQNSQEKEICINAIKYHESFSQ